jgi:thioredoxin-dependent peroxiredoxin
MIAVGQKLHVGFRLRVACDGVVKDMAFADLLTRPTVVSVHMKNRTPSCDRQNDSLIAHASALARSGYNVVGLSRDTASSHLRYAAAKNIPYPLASDPEYHFARAADSLIQKSMYGRKFIGPVRAAFILDHDATVLGVVQNVDAANLGPQLEELMSRL